MKIIELYGYSSSGKSYLANKINSQENLDNSFLRTSKKFRFLRIFIKLSYIFFLKFDDLIFISKMHKEFSFLKLKYKIKNYFSFLYLIGFIRNKIKYRKSVIIDHGIFQCMFSCYIFAKKKEINHKKISFILKNFFLKFPINFSYKIICLRTDFKIIKSRLKNQKKNSALLFLEQNEKKIHETYINIKNVSNSIPNEFIDFEFN